MRHQPITDDSFTEAEAMRLVRSLGSQPRPSPRGPKPERHAVLTRTVETEIIPRLLKACQVHPPALPPTSPDDVGSDQVSALTQVLLSGTQPQATAFVEHMRDSGISCESLFLHLMTPAARLLGVMWAEDDCDFADVTIGMLRLANVMRLVGGAFEAEVPAVQAGPRALLVQAPGEQHGFGVAMLASFFRRAGWNVVSEPMADSTALISMVRRDWFSLVGISVACSDRLDGVAADISAMRAVSRNPSIGIMVGGFAFLEHPQLAEMVGADCTASDAPQAVARANALVSHLTCRR